MSQLTSLFYNSKIDPKKSEPKSAEDFQVFKQILERAYDNTNITPQAANTIKRLIESKLIPHWFFYVVKAEIGIEKLYGLADDGEVGSPMCWSCYEPNGNTGIVAICPSLRGDTLYSPFTAIGRDMHGRKALYALGGRKPVCIVEVSEEQANKVHIGDVELKVVEALHA